MTGDNDFHPINLPWDVHPERDQTWFVKKTKNMSRRQIAQELECNFNTSGDTVVHPDDMQWLFENVKRSCYIELVMIEIFGFGKNILKAAHIF